MARQTPRPPEYTRDPGLVNVEGGQRPHPLVGVDYEPVPSTTTRNVRAST
jgi:hypothetical protein